MKLFLTTVCLVLAISAFSQKSSIKFGEVPLEDMKMTVYPHDSSASAVILSDYGEAYIQVSENSTLNFERHIRIKILTKEGVDWANAKVYLYQNGSTEEKVSGLKAATYNLENGQIIESKMTKDAIFKEKFNRNRNVVKFTLPNVKEGSVVEYSYKIISEFFTEFPDWEFQHTIPTRQSEFWATIPDFFVYEKYMQGYLSVNDYTIKDKPASDYSSKAHHWLIKNVPAFRKEPYITCEDDYRSKINFALSHYNFPRQPIQEVMGSWEKLNKDLLDNSSFGKIISGSGFLKKTVDETTAGLTDQGQRLAAIHNYVKENVEWDGYQDYYAANLKKVLDEKKGSSGDINLLLASMLEKAGFKVSPVLLSTRDHGFIRKEYPMAGQFNHVVCLVRLPENKTVWLDATNKFLPINMLPENCLNGEGLVISNDNFGWINLSTKIKSKTIAVVDLAVEENAHLSGKLNFIRDGYDANNMRANFSSKGEETYLKEFFSSKTWTVNKSSFENMKEFEKPAKENHELVIADHASAARDIIYINPFIILKLESNPFTLDQRSYPVDFGSMQEKIYMFKLTVPDNYLVDEIPQNKVITLPGNAARYLYNLTQSGNVINLTSNFQINKYYFGQEEYPHLKEFYNQVVAKEAEQIVLKKK